MPYINVNERERLLAGGSISNPGELNFVISNSLNRYIRGRDMNYQTLNDAIGALEAAKLELYRRLAVPYEDFKIATNGDVYLGRSDLGDA